MVPDRNRDAAVSDSETAEQLLTTLDQLARELAQSVLSSGDITLDSSLSRDLGFDSLARVEMTLRIEDAFNVHLPARTLAAAETPRDLLQQILAARSAVGRPVNSNFVRHIQPTGETTHTPDRVQTLQELLAWHTEAHPDQEHIYLYGDSEQVEQVITYQQLYTGATGIAEGLLAQGMEPGQTVAIMLPTSSDYFQTFFGVLLARGVPVPIYPPARLSQLEDHLRRHATILGNAGTVMLVTVPEATRVSHLLQPLAPCVRRLLTVQDLRAGGNRIAVGRAATDDLAFLQYTSGSTGNPKGVMLTHANLLANLRAMGSAVGVQSQDIFVSWLPLYHDMGLIGAWFGSLYYGMPLVSIPTQLFLARPSLWLHAIARHRATISAAPNFAYELCLRIRDRELGEIDLSSWRMAFNGAEPVNPATLRRFADRFGKFGFRPEAMKPVYGLAESSVGVAFPPAERGALIDRIHRQELALHGVARPAPAGASDALEIPSAGQPMPGHQVRIVDSHGRELPEREEGRLQFRGPSTTQGYFRNPEKSRDLFDGEWANSGDLAYIAGGDIFITGRSKDLIIRAGRNIYPQELESAAGEVTGVRKGCVAVFGTDGRRDAEEKLVIVAETRETDARVQERIRQEIRKVSMEILGAHADDIQLVPPRTIPKTSSGKLRRSATADLYRQGLLRQGSRSVWWQVTRLALAGLVPRARRQLRELGEGAYAAWCWLCLLLLAPLAWAVVVAFPHRGWNWWFMHRTARMMLALTGTRLQVIGAERIPREGCILVANHASYLDGLVVLAALPRRYHFVAKAELERNFFTRAFLNRLECRYVERFDTEKSVADSNRLIHLARQGQVLFFFPEGTFRRMPGIAPFHLGAFACAAEARTPVIAVTIVGTRSKLRADSWFPRRGHVQVIVGSPIRTDQGGWHGAVALRDAARREMVRRSGEPDLGTESLHG